MCDLFEDDFVLGELTEAGRAYRLDHQATRLVSIDSM